SGKAPSAPAAAPPETPPPPPPTRAQRRAAAALAADQRSAAASLARLHPRRPSRLVFAVPVTFPNPAAPGGQGTGVLAGALPVATVSDWVRHISTGPD